ncbi:EPIDERMAL PATTERNING FACTOR-like protein 5 [Abrus precatorius]|uniref:Epidermal patterning factor-like protein n=1 Tax=Abrus precatorius TaxID=3816 RepID=A0A8B8KHX2_ABRPR|nr:EPIDERMAL PATTERNING FACTOR-like protein 5 [Abrus precatorius]
MKARFFCFLLALQIMSWVCVARRPFPPSVAMSHPGPKEKTTLLSSPPYTVESEKGLMGREDMSLSGIEQEAYKGVRKIGSSPPSCEHKCYGCTPCEAIQVPNTSSRHSHLGIQYANYEPESWKCKCGPSFYSP